MMRIPTSDTCVWGVKLHCTFDWYCTCTFILCTLVYMYIGTVRMFTAVSWQPNTPLSPQLHYCCAHQRTDKLISGTFRILWDGCFSQTCNPTWDFVHVLYVHVLQMQYLSFFLFPRCVLSKVSSCSWAHGWGTPCCSSTPSPPRRQVRWRVNTWAPVACCSSVPLLIEQVLLGV